MYLRLTNKKLRSIFYAILLIVGAYFVGSRLAYALNTGMDKSVVFILMFFTLLMVPYIYKKMGTGILVKGLFFLCWIPIHVLLSRYAPFGGLYFYEFAVWVFLGFIFISAVISNDPRLRRTLKRFPFLPFLIYIGGALITYLLTNSSLSDLAYIRFVCILPLLMCFLACYVITTVEEAEKLIWIILTSTGIIFGLLVLLGEKSFTFVQQSTYASVSGRLSTVIGIPYFGSISILPTTISFLFASVFIYSFNFVLNHRSFYARTYASIISIIAVAGMILGQGRGAIIASLCSILVMSILCRKIAKKKFNGTILKMMVVLFIIVGTFWYVSSQSKYEGFYKHGMIMFNDPLSDKNLLGRIAVWQDSLEVIFRNPFGVGLHGFEYSLDGSSWASHNIYLWMILSFGIFGIIGFAWILYILFRMFRDGLNSGRHNLQMLCIGGIGALVLLLVAGTVDPIFDSSTTVTIIWSPLAVIMAAVMSHDLIDKGTIIDGKKKKQNSTN